MLVTDWLPYLTTCRTLATRCELSLRNVDRALWVAANDPHLADVPRAGKPAGATAGIAE
jgi:hypothetical protein